MTINRDKPALLAEWPVAIWLPIQWGDQDSFGHVNNTVPIRWFESARIAYLDEIDKTWMGHGPTGIGPILASITCNYRRQLTFPDTVAITARITRLGNSSLNMTHAVYSTAQDAITAEGDSVIVCFDYEAQKPVRIPDAIRAAIERLEGAAR